jgi:hypothetical protein
MIYNKIEDGTITNVKELLLEVCPSYGVKFKDGIIQYGKPSDFHKKCLDEATQKYAEFQNKTDEELQQYIDNTFEKLNKEKEESFKHYQAKAIKYDNIIKQLKLWEHTDTWDKMYNDIMQGLVKEYEFSIKMIKEYADRVYEKETLEDYKTRETKYYLKQIKRYSDDYANDIEYNEKNNQIIKGFVDSLKKL